MDTILIVEDEVYVRENLAHLLTLEEYHVLTAEDGQKALEIINTSKQIDLIISDIMMPNLDGHKLLRKLQGNEATELIPLIFLTAKTNHEEIRKGMNIGADDYITKPFSAEEILDAVKIRLKKQKVQQAVLNNLKENIIKYVPHELRTPLVSILGFSDLMLADLDSISSADSKYMLETIKKAGIRLYEWVEKFVLFTEIETNSKFHSHNQKREKINCEIKDIKWEENFVKNRAWSERKNDIEVKLEDASLEIDKAHLRFILKELIENSAKFSDPGTMIIATGTKNGKYYKLAFSDKGIGFKDGCINKIEAFQQFDRDNMQQHGNGLGLAIVNKMLLASDGELDLKSKENEYTVLTVNVPLARM